jgi:quercetin dioxygenase-like cupin family protein
MNVLRLSLILAALASAGLACARQSGPSDSKGNVSKPVAALELGPEIEGMTGRQLRMRMVTLAPGGTIANHSHKDRPSIEYIVQGTVIEYRDGKAKEYGPGEFITADKATTHGWENKGTAPAILMPVDVFKP